MQSSANTPEIIYKSIQQLDSESLDELANFVEYLEFKHKSKSKSQSETSLQSNQPERSGKKFLQNIAGICTTLEDDISERDEEILTKETHSIYGFSSVTDRTK